VVSLEKAATPETRKRILRTVIVEIIARVDDNQIDLKIHWQGGDQSAQRRTSLDPRCTNNRQHQRTRQTRARLSNRGHPESSG
jgi:hypothetical protein